MAKPPPEDPRITDLSRYRKQRAQAKRRPAPQAQGPRPSFLGANPRAGLILAVLALVVAAFWLAPLVMKLL